MQLTSICHEKQQQLSGKRNYLKVTSITENILDHYHALIDNI